MFRYPQQALFVSSGEPFSDQVTSGSIWQLSRVQNVEFEIVSPRAEHSYLEENTDLLAVDRPRVNLSFEYLATAGGNEQKIGLIVNGLAGAFSQLNAEKNYYIQLENEFVDANFPNDSAKTVIGIGNVVLNGYNIAGSAGGILSITCAGEGLNCCTYTGTVGQVVPAIDTETAALSEVSFVLPPANAQLGIGETGANAIVALGAKDLVMQFPEGSAFGTIISGDGCILQSFNLAFSIDRAESHCLGHAYPKERRIQMPIHIALSVEAVMNRYEVDQLNNVSCDGHDISIIVNEPCSTGQAIAFHLSCLKLESQHITSNLDNFQTVAFNWNGVVAGLNSDGCNVFIEGSYVNTGENPIRPPHYYMYDDFEDYASGPITNANKNVKVALTGYAGEETGIFTGRTTGFIVSYDGLSWDTFETYSIGLKNIGFTGIPSGAFMGTGYVITIEQFETFGYDMFEEYSTGAVSSLDGWTVTGINIYNGFVLAAQP